MTSRWHDRELHRAVAVVEAIRAMTMAANTLAATQRAMAVVGADPALVFPLETVQAFEEFYLAIEPWKQHIESTIQKSDRNLVKPVVACDAGREPGKGNRRRKYGGETAPHLAVDLRI